VMCCAATGLAAPAAPSPSSTMLNRPKALRSTRNPYDCPACPIADAHYRVKAQDGKVLRRQTSGPTTFAHSCEFGADGNAGLRAMTQIAWHLSPRTSPSAPDCRGCATVGVP
jgi:hypothetical protein